MDHFNYHHGELCAEKVAVADIVAEHGTPLFIYSRATLERHWHVFDKAFGDHKHLICYAVKANSNLAVLNIFARLGSGFDIVSLGELERVLAAGGDPKKIVFSGVCKLSEGIRRALEVGIYCFNVESEQELIRIQDIAKQMKLTAPISIRVNPDIDAKTHPYIATGLKENKFGVDIVTAKNLYQLAHTMSNIEIKGIDCHIGSQLTELHPFLDSIDRIQQLMLDLEKLGITPQHLDIGGGLGVRYQDEEPPPPAEYARALIAKLNRPDLEIIIEPGRAIAANAGILVTKIEYIKDSAHKNFAIVDAAMNDLLRPALYDAWQEIIPLKQQSDIISKQYDIVGPVCETGDFLGKDRSLAIEVDDCLAVRTAGAYGFTMSSNYNSRPRAAEVMVDGDQCYIIRQREATADLYQLEKTLPEA